MKLFTAEKKQGADTVWCVGVRETRLEEEFVPLLEQTSLEAAESLKGTGQFIYVRLMEEGRIKAQVLVDEDSKTFLPKAKD